MVTSFGNRWRGGGGVSQGIGAQSAHATVRLGQLEVFETYFFDIVITYNDHQEAGVSPYVFWKFVALLTAGRNPCQRREMIVSTNNGSHE